MTNTTTPPRVSEQAGDPLRDLPDFDAKVQARAALDRRADERALFEKAMNDARFFPAELCFARTKSPSGRDEYANTHLQSCWVGWQARADLTQQSAKLAALAGADTEHSQAARDVLAERRRQDEAEGWTPQHDDEHDGGELSLAAACYALAGDAPHGRSPSEWPWDESWWKPADDRRNLVKAGALILADIERIDRAAMSAATEKEPKSEN